MSFKTLGKKVLNFIIKKFNFRNLSFKTLEYFFLVKKIIFP